MKKLSKIVFDKLEKSESDEGKIKILNLEKSDELLDGIQQWIVEEYSSVVEEWVNEELVAELESKFVKKEDVTFSLAFKNLWKRLFCKKVDERYEAKYTE